MTKEELKIQKREEKEKQKYIKHLHKKEKRELKELKRHEVDLEFTVKKNVKETLKEEHEEEMRPIKEKIRKKNEAPHLRVLEEVGNSISHGIGALCSIVALIFMLYYSHNALMITASIVYSFAMFFMFLNSCLYHAYGWGHGVKRLWRRFDYSSIYLQVAGTFAPLQLIEMGRVWGSVGETAGIIYFIVMWIVVVVGITFVGVFGPGRMRKLHFTLYFVMGWSGVALIPMFFMGNNFWLFFYILLGGVIYSLGMIPFAALKGKPGAHFIWHLFVIFGALIQYLGILLFIFMK